MNMLRPYTILLCSQCRETNPDLSKTPLVKASKSRSKLKVLAVKENICKKETISKINIITR